MKFINFLKSKIGRRIGVILVLILIFTSIFTGCTTSSNTGNHYGYDSNGHYNCGNSNSYTEGPKYTCQKELEVEVTRKVYFTYADVPFVEIDIYNYEYDYKDVLFFYEESAGSLKDVNVEEKITIDIDFSLTSEGEIDCSKINMVFYNNEEYTPAPI